MAPHVMVLQVLGLTIAIALLCVIVFGITFLLIDPVGFIKGFNKWQESLREALELLKDKE